MTLKLLGEIILPASRESFPNLTHPNHPEDAYVVLSRNGKVGISYRREDRLHIADIPGASHRVPMMGILRLPDHAFRSVVGQNHSCQTMTLSLWDNGQFVLALSDICGYAFNGDYRFERADRNSVPYLHILKPSYWIALR